MQENEELMRKGSFYILYLISLAYLLNSSGKKPRRHREELPKPTELMKQREHDLELDKNMNKTMIVTNPGGRGPGQPGFYCETCNRTYKDSVGYLDHINGRSRE
jgi:U4/U6.U5 tri-snRNP component SNU23